MPRIGLGTWSVFDTDQDLSWLTDEALAAGVTLFDSSPMYGRAEDRLAEALGGKRAMALVATKVSAVAAEQRAVQIARACALFGTVDLFQIHNIVSWRLHLPKLLTLKERGVVKAIGASQGLQVTDEAFEEIMRTGSLDAIQVRYNPKRREAADRILPLAREMGLDVLVMQPLRWGAMLASPTASELAALEVPSWAAAVLRWILSDPRVTTVLTSTSKPGRIGENAGVASQPAFAPDQLELFDKIMARGIDPHAATGSSQTDAPPPDLHGFLATQLGGAYCDPCLSRHFGSPSATIAQVRNALTSQQFVQDTAPCLACGDVTRIVRSRTIMR